MLYLTDERMSFSIYLYIVAGGWTQFQDWTPCSASCGNGTHSRHRTCTSPSPDSEGEPCVGLETETKSCNPEPCPGKSNINNSYCPWTKWFPNDVIMTIGEHTLF